MLGVALSLLSGVIAASPVTPMPWFEFKDYPMKAFEKKWEGVTRFELLIAPDGTIANCKINSSSGHEEFDKLSCYLAQKRVKFRGARDANGQAVWGVYRSQAVWAFPEHNLSSPPPPDIEVSLNKLPDDAKEPPAVKLAYAVDASGNPSSCTMMPSSLEQPQILVDLACKQLLETTSRTPVMSPSGQPVPAVKTGAVLFNEGS